MSSKVIEIAGQKIGAGHKPYIIAEISGNHNGDIEIARKLMQCAKTAGADAVKLQTYSADSLTIKSYHADFNLKSGTWAGYNIYDLYAMAATPIEWIPDLINYGVELGITVFSSVFDRSDVEALAHFGVPAFKIASNELTDWPLIEAVIQTQLPIILSTGTATKSELTQTIDFISSLGAGDRLVVLHCVSAYPALFEDSNLQTMLDISKSYDVITGLSDHTLGTSTAVAAAALGAAVIEKHITLDRNDDGPDSSFSLEPQEVLQLCEDVKSAWESIGIVKYGGESNLAKRGIFTRQLWAIQDISIGDELTWKNIRSMRAPSGSGGITPMNYREVIDQKALVRIEKHTPIKEKYFK